MTTIHLVFEGEGPNLRFVEAETPDGKSVKVGRWADDPCGYKVLVLTAEDIEQVGRSAVCSVCGKDGATVAVGQRHGLPVRYCLKHYEIYRSAAAGRPVVARTKELS